jgi:hypothetical protein
VHVAALQRQNFGVVNLAWNRIRIAASWHGRGVAWLRPYGTSDCEPGRAETTSFSTLQAGRLNSRLPKALQRQLSRPP